VHSLTKGKPAPVQRQWSCFPSPPVAEVTFFFLSFPSINSINFRTFWFKKTNENAFVVPHDIGVWAENQFFIFILDSIVLVPPYLPIPCEN